MEAAPLDASLAWRRHEARGRVALATRPRHVTMGPLAPEEQAELLQAVATRSDRPAFAALFRHFAPRLKNYLLRGGCPDNLAEELVQEAMAKVWTQARQFDPARAQVSTWVFTIARNLRIDAARRAASRPRLESASGDETHPEDALDALFDETQEHDIVLPGSPEGEFNERQRAQHLREALAQLPEEQARILHLSYFEETPHAAIAQSLGLPLGTVKSRIRLAVGHLRRLLAALEP